MTKSILELLKLIYRPASLIIKFRFIFGKPDPIENWTKHRANGNDPPD